MGLGIFAIILGVFGFISSGLLGILGLALSANCVLKSKADSSTPDMPEEDREMLRSSLKNLGVVGLVVNGGAVAWFLIKIFIL